MLTVLVAYTDKFLTASSTHIIYRAFLKLIKCSMTSIYQSSIRETTVAMMSGGVKLGNDVEYVVIALKC